MRPLLSTPAFDVAGGAGQVLFPVPFAAHQGTAQRIVHRTFPAIYEEDIGRKQIPQTCGKEAPRAVHHRAHRKRAAGMFLIRGGASFPTIPG